MEGQPRSMRNSLRRLASPVAVAVIAGATAVAGATPSLAAERVGHVANLTSHYIDPFEGQSWGTGRIDQGIDWKPNGPQAIRAIGNGVVTYSKERAPGWPGGCIVYRLTDGPMTGRHIYVAEHVKGLTPKGKRIRIGETIGTAVPGFPNSEWGWAKKDKCRPAVPYRAGCGEGWATPGGLAFARFLRELGVTSMGTKRLSNPGRGPDVPYNGGCRLN